MPAAWDDLVLPEEVLANLRLLARWARAARRTDADRRPDPDRAAGPVALFTGPPGTGKTLAAQVVAEAAGMPLFRPDPAADGPLRAHLTRLCDAAAACGAALLIDGALVPPGGPEEARTAAAVRDGIAGHPGLVVLEAFGPAVVHPALVARASVRVRFEPPDARQRDALWQRALPTVDRGTFREIAGLALTGRQIRFAADAATATADGDAISPADLRRACRLVGATDDT